MTNKKKSRLLPAILLLIVVALLAVVLVPRLISQSNVTQTLKSNTKDKEVTDLLAMMSKNPNKDSQEYKEARQTFPLSSFVAGLRVSPMIAGLITTTQPANTTRLHSSALTLILKITTS